MLYLKPPFHIVKGIAVFPDHEREDVVHYAPAAPHLTLRTDTNGEQVPVFQLLKYRGDAGSGGFLNFSVDLGISDELKDEVATDLRRIMDLRDKPIMSPIHFEEGDVQLMILGAGSTSEDDGDTAAADVSEGDARFVKAIHHSKPSLYGDNTAIFSVELDADGVQLMEAAMAGETSGIGIIYSLNFLALRPAYEVRVDVDWERVQTHFEETFSTRVFVASTEVSTVIDKLIEDRVITIEVDTFLAEDSSAGSWVGNRNQAIEEFKDMITESFFTPVTPPERMGEDTWTKVTETAERVGLLLATGGWSGVASLSYRKMDMTRIDKKSMNLRMRERVTMRKSIYPQAVLEGLLALKDSAGDPLDLSRFVTEVTLGDRWFENRRVTAYALANFQASSIAAMSVTLDYGGERKFARLTDTDREEPLSWPSRIVNDVMEMPVSYSYTVDFADVDVAERPGKISSPEMVVEGEAIEVAPQNDRIFFIDDIIIGTTDFPWESFPTIELHLRYRDEANVIDLNDSFLLTQAENEITWHRFRMDAEKPEYEMRVVFHAADNRNRELPWRVLDQERFVLSDPMPEKRTVTVVPNVDWQTVSMVLVEMKYLDTDNNLTVTKVLTFMGTTPQGQGPQTFEVALRDATKRFVNYSGSIIKTDGTREEIPSSVTQESILIVSSGMMGRAIMEIRGPEGSFEAAGRRHIELELEFEDADRGLKTSDRMVFDRPGQIKFFEFDFARDEVRAVTVMRTDVHENGLQTRRDMGQLTDSLIVLDFD